MLTTSERKWYCCTAVGLGARMGQKSDLSAVTEITEEQDESK